MFRLTVNIGGIFDLYVSKTASRDLRAFSPPTDLTEGPSENVFVDILRFHESADYGRVRHLILLTHGDLDGKERMCIRTYLEHRLTREFDKLMEARNRQNVADDRRQIYVTCEHLDNNFELYSSGEWTYSADSVDSAVAECAHDDKADIGRVQGTNDFDGVESEIGEYTGRGRDGTSRVDEMEDESDVSAQGVSCEDGRSSGEKATSGSKDTVSAYPSWPIFILTAVLFMWLAGGTYGMYIFYSDVSDLHDEVISLHEKVADMMWRLEPGSPGSEEVNQLVENIGFISRSLGSAADDGVVRNPLVEAVRSLNTDMDLLKGELVHGNGSAKAGSLMERIHLFEKGTLRVLDEKILSEFSAKVGNLNQEVSKVRTEMEILTGSEDPDSPLKLISGLMVEIGDLRRRIRELTDGTREDSLVYAIGRLNAEMIILRTATLYQTDSRVCETVQMALAALDHYKDEIDGQCASMTVEAIREFQRKHGLVESGVLEADHVRLLRSKVHGVERGGGASGLVHED